ncbi:MAG: glycosyltransferase [Erysipelotrichaceae bacterium]
MIAIVIPTLNPTRTILSVVTPLLQQSNIEVIVVNDGSDPEKAEIFNHLELLAGCHVLTHTKNLGKGAALKTAFRYYLEQMPDFSGIVTCDDDGQHAFDDICNMVASLKQHPEQLLLGVRDFSKLHVPFKSKIGNQLTRAYLRVFCGIKVQDSQTGLRGIPKALVEMALACKGSGFEYETNLLLKAKRMHIDIIEVDIETLYVEQNRATRFDPILDSLRIYSQLFTYTLSSAASFLLDMVLFALFITIFQSFHETVAIVFATLFSRAGSSLFNFSMNSRVVFKQKAQRAQLLRYYSLWLVQMMISIIFVRLVTLLFGMQNVVVWKLIVDCSLFLCSYQVQKHWVYR